MTRSRYENPTLPVTGFVDAAGAEVQALRYCQTVLLSLFSSYGYEEVMMPLLERASSFSEEVVGSSPWPGWDRRGVFYLQLQNYDSSYSDLPEHESAVLVPEATTAVARFLAREHVGGRLVPPRKISYLAPCFRNELITSLAESTRRQFHQCGVEVLGSNDTRADLEIVSLACEGLFRLGFDRDEVRVRAGSPALFNAVCNETGMCAIDILVVKELMDAIAAARAGGEHGRLGPQVAGVLSIVGAYSPSDTVWKKWDVLMHSFGPVLDTDAVEVLGGREVVFLNALASAVEGRGMQCLVDPSVLRSHEYYTGFSFEVDVCPHGGEALLALAGGGRSEKLLGRFLGDGEEDFTVPAVGFAFHVEKVVEALQTVGAMDGRRAKRSVVAHFDLGHAKVDAVVCGEADDEAALAIAERLRVAGERVDYYVGDDRSRQALEHYARRLDARLIAL